MATLTETKRTKQDFEYLVDGFDTEHGGGADYVGKAVIAGMVILSHIYIDKAGDIPQKDKENFREHFPMLTPKEWYHVACEIKDYYLGHDVNQPFYKFNLNKHVAVWDNFKKINNKYNDFKIK